MSSDTNIWETGVNENGNGTDNNQYFISDTSDAEKRLTIQRGTGNIGVGTNEPSQLLDVSGNINVSGNIYLSNTGTIYKNGVEYAGGSDGGTTVWQDNGAKIYYNAGNVGINTSDPSESLEVIGNIKATSLEGTGTNITALDAGNITSGTLDNTRLPANISITGDMTAKNLNVTGVTTTINTDTYQTENLEIISTGADGPSLKITHDTVSHDVMQVIDASGTQSLTMTHEGKIGIGTDSPSAPLHIYDTSDVFKVSNSEITINRNILPETNDSVDIGSAERKIRDMYISDNSLWIGDDHKLAVSVDGTMKFRKRNKSVLPKVVREASGNDNAALAHINSLHGTSYQSVTELKLNHVLSYARTINPEYKTSDIFGDDTEDYDQDTAADAWQINSSKIYLGSGYTNIGIGTNDPDPNFKLHVDGNVHTDGTISADDITIKGSAETGSGAIKLNCELNSHGVTIKGPPHSAYQSYTLTLPSTAPEASKVLSTDASGNLSWIDPGSSSASSIQNITTTASKVTIDTEMDVTNNVTIKGSEVTGSGAIKLNCKMNSHGVAIKGPPHEAAATYTLTLPSTAPEASKVLSTDASGNLSWIDQASGGSGSGGEVTSVTSNILIQKSIDPATTPNILTDYIEETDDDYKILSFTYDSTNANASDQTEYLLNFPQEVDCDILMVGGGGGGSQAHGGGGGAGSVIFMKDVKMNGEYTFKIGNGGDIEGTPGSGLGGRGFKGKDSEIYKSEINKVIAEGGGGGGENSDGKGGNGGSGGGGDGYDNTTLNVTGGTANAYTPVLEGITGIKYGNNGGTITSNPWGGAGGGGAGGNGVTSSTDTGNNNVGGVGIEKATLNGTEYNFKSRFNINNTSIGHHTGSDVYFGGGGGGGVWGTTTGSAGGLGGGGGGGRGGLSNNTGSGEDGTANTGGGGGGGGDNKPVGGKGGSGVIIIRYKIIRFLDDVTKFFQPKFYKSVKNPELISGPVAHYINDNSPISDLYKYSLFKYDSTNDNGSNQTDYQLIFSEDTEADVLIVAGGGGGGGGHGGGGGAGQLVFIHKATLNGTYNIKVGKGGTKGTNPSSGGIEPTKGADSIFDSVTAEGGGANGGSALKDGGSGAGGDAWLNGLGTKSKGLKNTNVDTYSSGNVYSKGNDGGEGGNEPGQGGGGGGAGAAGEDGASGNTGVSPGNGGNGLSSINEINFDFKSNFGSLAGKLESDNLIYFAAGGGGGGWDISTPETNSVGGKGGGGGGGGGSGTSHGSDGDENTGSGGGGGSANYGEGGAGGSGVVIIRYLAKTLTQDIDTTLETKAGENIEWDTDNNKFTLTSNVAITSNLDVFNDINFMGNLYQNGELFVSGNGGEPIKLTVENIIAPTSSPAVLSYDISDESEYKTIYFNYDSGNVNASGQTEYTLNFSNSTECDILLVGGGGGGGSDNSGGGGAGGLVFLENITLNNGVTIKVGGGGAGAATNQTNTGQLGKDSGIIFGETYIAKGGGGGGTGQTSVLESGTNGGSGGGSSYESYNGSPGTSTQEQYLLNGIRRGWGFTGGDGKVTSGSGQGAGGGGGGASEVGIDGNIAGTKLGGHGGDGKYEVNSNNFKTIFNITNTTIGDHIDGKVYFSGGGGGGNDNDTNSTSLSDGSGYNNRGGFGGGGGGGYNNSYKSNPGIANTGGGGGGTTFFGSNYPGAAGGSGIVILRYKYRKTLNIPSHYYVEKPGPQITSGPVAQVTDSYVTGSDMYKYMMFTYDSANDNSGQTEYALNFSEDTNADILIVSGGGAGGTYIGGGGGAGGVLHIKNTTINTGSYSIKVGKGGDSVVGSAVSSSAQQGNNSKAFGIEVFGGGYGGGGNWGSSTYGQDGSTGGSGGAGGSASNTAGSGGTKLLPDMSGALISTVSYEYYGGNGADSMLFSSSNAGGATGANGGGGAGGDAPANTDQGNAGVGADGIPINIIGTIYYWGGGGGGGQYEGTKAGNGGKGGGGGGNGSQQSEGVGIGGSGGISDGQDGDPEGDGTPTAGSGGAHTGGGGGGTGRTTGSPNPVSGAGGSGVVIIRYLAKSLGQDIDSTLKNKAGSGLAWNAATNKYDVSYLAAKDMIVQVKHNDYKKMQRKESSETGWQPVDNDTSTGFVIGITPKSVNSDILVSVNAFISFDQSTDSRWWGARLYRKIGTGTWTWISDAGGDGTGDVDNVGTSVWFSDQGISSNSNAELGNISAKYLDKPNTLEQVFYTIYWRARISTSDPGDEILALNRSVSHGDSYRASPHSSWSAYEIWQDGLPYTATASTITIDYNNVGIGTSAIQTAKLLVNGDIKAIGNIEQQYGPGTTYSYLFLQTSAVFQNDDIDLYENRKTSLTLQTWGPDNQWQSFGLSNKIAEQLQNCFTYFLQGNRRDGNIHIVTLNNSQTNATADRKYYAMRISSTQMKVWGSYDTTYPKAYSSALTWDFSSGATIHKTF